MDHGDQMDTTDSRPTRRWSPKLGAYLYPTVQPDSSLVWVTIPDDR